MNTQESYSITHTVVKIKIKMHLEFASDLCYRLVNHIHSCIPVYTLVENWPVDLTVQTEYSEVQAKKTEGQNSPSKIPSKLGSY